MKSRDRCHQVLQVKVRLAQKRDDNNRHWLVYSLNTVAKMKSRDRPHKVTLFKNWSCLNAPRL